MYSSASQQLVRPLIVVNRHLTIGLNGFVLVVREHNVPDFLPLNFRRGTARSLSAQQLGGRARVNAALSVMIRNITHQLLRQSLVISQFLSRHKVAVASVAHVG